MNGEQWAAISARIDAERETARDRAKARGEEYATVLPGISWDVGAPMPHLFSSGHRTFVLFRPHQPTPGWDGTWSRPVDTTDPARVGLSVIEFVLTYSVRFGGPNDEALHGHPLSDRGLEPYRAHEVHNSSWITEAERINSVHSGHLGGWHRRMRHYVLTFHDQTLECLAKDLRLEQLTCAFPEAVGQVAAML
ncbi:hypothetical protein OG871_36375 [Kitasatospora sp. NBC_00374]|uniref:hypothetical protein n=1 Tax=Kitasatospora sp. NBC_00374 TaxID=2975964 RepID=UPI0030E21037